MKNAVNYLNALPVPEHIYGVLDGVVSVRILDDLIERIPHLVDHYEALFRVALEFCHQVLKHAEAKLVVHHR